MYSRPYLVRHSLQLSINASLVCNTNSKAAFLEFLCHIFLELGLTWEARSSLLGFLFSLSQLQNKPVAYEDCL